MRLLLEIGGRKQKALSPVEGGGGLWRRIIEPFAGAWQRNISEKRETVLTYPTLYACLNRIAQDIGKLPFQLVRQDDNGIWVLDTANTAYWPVLRKPNHYQTAQQFREAWTLSRLIHGNTYVLKERDNRNAVVRLYVLDPTCVMPMVTESGDVYYQLNYRRAQNLLPQDYPGEQLVIPASEIIHDRINCFDHHLIGVPPLCAATWPAVKNLKILRDSTTYFSNGARPSGILTAPAGMTDDDAARIKEYWDSNFTGDKAGKVGLIGADMKFTPFSFNSADSQLVEQMKYSDEQICQPFGIPPFKIGLGTIPAGMKVDDLNQLYYSDALQAPIEAMENLLDEGLNIQRPQGVELDLEPLLRMDIGKQAEVETKLTGGGVKTPNEARKRFNLAPLEGGDTVYMQQQDIPLEEARKNKIQSAPVAPETPAAEEADAAAEAASEQERALQARKFLGLAIEAARREALNPCP